MKFFGRVEQRKKIHHILEKKQQMVSLIYGRRRVGKSELIKQVLRESDMPSIYYECKQTTELNNVESISTLISEKFNLPKLAFGDMEAVLEFLFQKAKQESLVVVLDEYSYLRLLL